ncbi:MAG: tyramine---L-glutamate ligase [Methanobacterium sp.]|uniref:ATP-grasp domain-containing protein n=1 Tax=Methanobacterium sp. TaxID=2164 RepID=UPI0003C99E2D|nr:ATP-grasp domain-containing protein [Methanobacterium sp.]MDI3549503.1 tyramine---L-glutamate ligase [Methanobacterium sp.]CDG64796.1 ATP-grasp fold domain-containing protein [Methanobacterium sp. MB1]
MNLLIFEYASAMGIKDPSLTAEGKAMLHGLTCDLECIPASYLISKQIDTIEGSQCQPIVIGESVEDWLSANVSDFDYCLPIAPEEDFILCGLTRLIEKNGVQIIGSNSDAVRICSDKYLTYKLLKDKVPTIPTHRIPWDEVELHASNVSHNKVVKPADGVSCSAVQVVDSEESFKNAATRVKEVSSLPYFLLQDYVEGTSASVSLISNGKEAVPLSLNQQNINHQNGIICYNGGKVPLSHPLENEAVDIAKTAVESIKGLKGYVGVDIILGEDEVHLVEVNSRITTPYVALRNMLNFNLGEAIVNAVVHGELPTKFILEREIEIQKKGNHLHLKVIN